MKIETKINSTEDKNKSALIKFVIAMAVFGTIGLFRKYIPLDSGIIAMARGLIGGLIILVYLRVTGKPFSVSHLNGKLPLLIVTGAVMGFNWVTLFEAYNYTTVATATLCYYMQPVFLVLISVVVFKERIPASKLICVFVALIGMVFVSGVLQTGISGNSEIKGILLGLASAALYAFVVSMNKFITDVDPKEKTAVQLLSAGAAMVIYLLIRGVLFDPSSWSDMTPVAYILLATICIVHTGIMYVMYFSSLADLRLTQVAILGFIDPVVALILSQFVLHEDMGITGLIGAVLILGSSIVSETLCRQS